jgi:hypothetical protein
MGQARPTWRWARPGREISDHAGLCSVLPDWLSNPMWMQRKQCSGLSVCCGKWALAQTQPTIGRSSDGGSKLYAMHSLLAGLACFTASNVMGMHHWAAYCGFHWWHLLIALLRFVLYNRLFSDFTGSTLYSSVPPGELPHHIAHSLCTAAYSGYLSSAYVDFCRVSATIFLLRFAVCAAYS